MVTVDFWYVVWAEGMRPHFCSNYYLAQAVGNNLKKRYAEPYKISRLGLPILGGGYNENPRMFFIDTGAMSQRQPLKRFPLRENVVISYRAHEEEDIRRSLEKFPQGIEKYDGQFYKIHCAPNTLCLTLAQGQQLYDCVVKGYPGATYLKE